MTGALQKELHTVIGTRRATGSRIGAKPSWMKRVVGSPHRRQQWRTLKHMLKPRLMTTVSAEASHLTARNNSLINLKLECTITYKWMSITLQPDSGDYTRYISQYLTEWKGLKIWCWWWGSGGKTEDRSTLSAWWETTALHCRSKHLVAI